MLPQQREDAAQEICKFCFGHLSRSRGEFPMSLRTFARCVTVDSDTERGIRKNSGGRLTIHQRLIGCGIPRITTEKTVRSKRPKITYGRYSLTDPRFKFILFVWIGGIETLQDKVDFARIEASIFDLEFFGYF